MHLALRCPWCHALQPWCRWPWPRTSRGTRIASGTHLVTCERVAQLLRDARCA